MTFDPFSFGTWVVVPISVLVTKFDQNRPNGYGAGGPRSEEEEEEETARIQYISRFSTNIKSAICYPKQVID